MAQPGTTSRKVLALAWLALGLAMVAVPVWLGWTRWSVILNGHPVTLAVTLLCALAGIVAAAWAVATLVLGDRYDQEYPVESAKARTDVELRHRARWRIIVSVPALAVCLLTVAVLAWSRPFSAAPEAIEATRSGDGVRVADRLTWYELQPQRKNAAGRTIAPTVGLVFYPGARVDARAYANVLRPLAADGYLVVVLKEPFGIGLVHVNHAGRVLAVHPEVRSWAVGGHSLGGVAASTFADDHPGQVKGLVLFAAYPAGKLRRTDLRVLSISGSADGLATSAKIEAAKADLPSSTRYVVVPGAIHAYFGDYGNQPGDGTPATTRATAQAEIAGSTEALLASLVPRPTPPVKKR